MAGFFTKLNGFETMVLDTKDGEIRVCCVERFAEKGNVRWFELAYYETQPDFGWEIMAGHMTDEDCLFIINLFNEVADHSMIKAHYLVNKSEGKKTKLQFNCLKKTMKAIRYE